MLRVVLGFIFCLLGAAFALVALAMWAGGIGLLGAGSVGLLALGLLYAGLKRLRTSEPRKYELYRWGDPPPTTRQFGYAMHLGIRLQNGMTKWDVSRAIDAILENSRN
ncbi:MAG: hypothetical protein GX547_16300 [Phycisphaerae bacterium]|mgnify:CR=1 FL=1|nr:hypothetical protein [Phycisphaerae bacterium]